MNKIIEYFCYALLCTVLLFSVGVPMVYWYNNPETTQMQLTIKFWWSYIPILLSIVLLRTKKHAA